MQGELAAEQEHSLQLVMIVNTLRAERDSARQRLSTAEQRRVLNMAKRQLQASFSAAVADQGKLGSGNALSSSAGPSTKTIPPSNKQDQVMTGPLGSAPPANTGSIATVSAPINEPFADCTNTPRSSCTVSFTQDLHSLRPCHNPF